MNFKIFFALLVVVMAFASFAVADLPTNALQPENEVADNPANDQESLGFRFAGESSDSEGSAPAAAAPAAPAASESSDNDNNNDVRFFILF